MYQIVYVSTATREYDRDELERILAVSRKNNSLDGVTGMLCYHGGTFFQMLDWSMAFNQVSRREAQALDGFSELLKSGHDQRLGDGGAVTSDALDLIAGFRDTVLPGSRMTF